MTQENCYWGTGRRKTSIARVKISPAEKGFILLINGHPLEQYFAGNEEAKYIVKEPLELTRNLNNLSVKMTVEGGGVLGQAEAIRHGISRALIKMDQSLRPVLKKAGFLKRDPRMVERKKYGRRKARRRFQWGKR